MPAKQKKSPQKKSKSHLKIFELQTFEDVQSRVREFENLSTVGFDPRFAFRRFRFWIEFEMSPRRWLICRVTTSGRLLIASP